MLTTTDDAATTTWRPDPDDPASASFRSAVQQVLADFLAGQAAVLAPMGAPVEALLSLATAGTSGGKRLRPAFCFWGFVAAAGLPAQPAEQDALLAVSASLDLLHVSALVHDDVMDGSDLRRGRPAAHKEFEALHARQDRQGDAAAFGRAGAILLGDLLLMWHSELLHRSGFDPAVLERGLRIVEAMRTEVTGGQYLDMVAQGRSAQPTAAALAEAELVTEFKSARYTVQRPCQLGAALAGGGPELLAGLAAYASPLGRAFQYRDDLLGVFGDEAVTGKPAGDDLREGKRTALVAHTRDRLDADRLVWFDARLGDPDLGADDVSALQETIAGCGAEAVVETMIETLAAQAVGELERTAVTGGSTAVGRAALRHLADAAVARSA